MKDAILLSSGNAEKAEKAYLKGKGLQAEIADTVEIIDLEADIRTSAVIWPVDRKPMHILMSGYHCPGWYYNREKSNYRICWTDKSPIRKTPNPSKLVENVKRKT